MNFPIVSRALFAFATLTVVAPTASAATPPATRVDDPLVLDAATLRDTGVVVDALARHALDEELKAPGEVRANAYSTELVTPRVESLVIGREARLGEVVKAGAPLVRLSSVAVAETQGALIVAEAEWQRLKALGPQAVSGRRYAEAQVARDQARAKLRAYGLTNGQIAAMLRKGSAGADGSFALLAPVAGRITSDDFLVGQRVEPGRTLFTLVEEGTVWVVAQLAPADAERVRPGTPAKIDAHGQTVPGKVIGRAHQTDERTRTVPVRIAVDNRADLLHPGELVTTRIGVGAGRAELAVPADAVVLLRNQPTVFLDRGQGRFEPVAVRVGDTRDGWTVIREGLAPGARYVRRGAFAFKARLLRAEIGDHD